LNLIYRSKYFHTNLQHCSDVGRLAFLDAQRRMSTIAATAQRMIGEQGSIGYIIDLLEDPEDARYDLKPIEIKAKFEYWYLVLIHLKNTSFSKRGTYIGHTQS
jgi:hypothetical protein